MTDPHGGLNRRQFLCASGAAGAAAAVTGSASGLAEAAQADQVQELQDISLASAPVLINPSESGITVLCAVNGPATGWVEYGTTESLGRRANGAVDGLLPYTPRLLAFRIRGLSPGQRCYYRVHARPVDFRSAYSVSQGPEVRSDIRSFRTLDRSAPTASFTVWNDTHENAATLAALAESLRSTPTDVLVWNGDVTNDINSEEGIIDQFIRPGGQAYANQTPLLLGLGNHDVRGRYARQLSRYVHGPAGRWYYTFRQGPLAGLVMDTGEDKPDDHRAYGGMVAFGNYRTEQQKWLAGAIEDPGFRSAAFRVAFLHIPLVWDDEVPQSWINVWGPGIRGWVSDDGLAKWHDLLVRGRVDLVISGHTHRHAWFPPNDQRPYGQLIGGGQRPETATIITGRADAKRLEVIMTDLQRTVLVRHEV